MKNIYRFIILNETSNFNKAFNVSQYLLYFLIFLMIVVLGFASFGIYKTIKPHPKQLQFNELLNNKRETINLIQNLINNNLVDSTLLSEYKVNNLYLKNDSLVPNIMPIKGIVTQSLDLSIMPAHNGLDIAAEFDNDVVAAQMGLVIFSDYLESLGNTIIISHPNNFFTLYSHLNKLYIDRLSYVDANEPIGTIGQSGNSDGPHLHFEIWKNSTIIDPRELIKEYKLNDVSIKKNK